MMPDSAEHALVERAQQLELARLIARVMLCRADVGDRSRSRLEDRPLKRRRQKPGVEAIDAAGRNQAAVQDHEAGQVLALASQTVGDPRAVARPALQAAAGVHEVIGARVLREVRDHRAHDGQVVDTRSDPRKQVADRDAALAVLAKLPRASQHVADVVELRRVRLDLDRLAMLAVEPGLGVERVDLRRAAVHEQEDHARRLGRELRRPGGERVDSGLVSVVGLCSGRAHRP